MFGQGAKFKYGRSSQMLNEAAGGSEDWASVWEFKFKFKKN